MSSATVGNKLTMFHSRDNDPNLQNNMIGNELAINRSVLKDILARLDSQTNMLQTIHHYPCNDENNNTTSNNVIEAIRQLQLQSETLSQIIANDRNGNDGETVVLQREVLNKVQEAVNSVAALNGNHTEMVKLLREEVRNLPTSAQMLELTTSLEQQLLQKTVFENELKDLRTLMMQRQVDDAVVNAKSAAELHEVLNDQRNLSEKIDTLTTNVVETQSGINALTRQMAKDMDEHRLKVNEKIEDLQFEQEDYKDVFVKGLEQIKEEDLKNLQKIVNTRADNLEALIRASLSTSPDDKQRQQQLQAQIVDLESALRQATTRYEKLDIDKTAADETIAESQRLLQKLTDENKIQGQRLEEYIAKLTTKEEELKTMEALKKAEILAMREEMDIKIAELNQQLEAKMEELQKANENVQNTQESLNDFVRREEYVALSEKLLNETRERETVQMQLQQEQAAHQALLREYNALETELKAARETIQRYETEIDKLRAEKEKLQSQSVVDSERVEELKGEIETWKFALEHQTKRLHAEMSRVRESAKKVMESKEKYQKRFEDLKKEMAAVQTQTDAANARAEATTETETSSTEAELAELRAEGQRLQSLNDDLQREQSVIVAESDALRLNVARLEDELRKNQEESQTLNRNVAEATKEKNELERRLRASEDRLATIEPMVVEKEAEAAQIKAELDAALPSMKQKAEELQQQLNEARTNYEDSAANLKAAENREVALQTRIEELVAKMENQSIAESASRAELEKQLVAEKEIAGEIRAEMENLKTQHDTAQNEVVVTKQRIRDLEGQVDTLTKTIASNTLDASVHLQNEKEILQREIADLKETNAGLVIAKAEELKQLESKRTDVRDEKAAVVDTLTSSTDIEMVRRLIEVILGKEAAAEVNEETVVASVEQVRVLKEYVERKGDSLAKYFFHVTKENNDAERTWCGNLVEEIQNMVVQWKALNQIARNIMLSPAVYGSVAMSVLLLQQRLSSKITAFTSSSSDNVAMTLEKMGNKEMKGLLQNMVLTSEEWWRLIVEVYFTEFRTNELFADNRLPPLIDELKETLQRHNSNENDDKSYLFTLPSLSMAIGDVFAIILSQSSKNCSNALWLDIALGVMKKLSTAMSASCSVLRVVIDLATNIESRIAQYNSLRATTKIITYVKLRLDNHNQDSRYRVRGWKSERQGQKEKVLSTLQIGHHPYTVKDWSVANGMFQYDVYGDFDRVFPPSTSNEKVGKECKELIHALNSGQSAMVIAYGASGAGKTSTLLNWYSPTEKRNFAGAIPEMCNVLSNKLETLELWAVELFADYSMPESRHYAVPVMTRQRTTFSSSGENERASVVFDRSGKDGSWVVKKDDPKNDMIQITDYSNSNLCEPHARRQPLSFAEMQSRRQFILLDPSIPSMEISTSSTPTRGVQDYNLGQFMALLAETRLNCGTPNNPDSSRTHLLIFMSFNASDKQKKRQHLIVADFAGVERAFECESLGVLSRFVGLPQDSLNKYYPQIAKDERLKSYQKSETAASPPTTPMTLVKKTSPTTTPIKTTLRVSKDTKSEQVKRETGHQNAEKMRKCIQQHVLGTDFNCTTMLSDVIDGYLDALWMPNFNEQALNEYIRPKESTENVVLGRLEKYFADVAVVCDYISRMKLLDHSAVKQRTQDVDIATAVAFFKVWQSLASEKMDSAAAAFWRRGEISALLVEQKWKYACQKQDGVIKAVCVANDNNYARMYDTTKNLWPLILEADKASNALSGDVLQVCRARLQEGKFINRTLSEVRTMIKTVAVGSSGGIAPVLFDTCVPIQCAATLPSELCYVDDVDVNANENGDDNNQQQQQQFYNVRGVVASVVKREIGSEEWPADMNICMFTVLNFTKSPLYPRPIYNPIEKHLSKLSQMVKKIIKEAEFENAIDPVLTVDSNAMAQLIEFKQHITEVEGLFEIVVRMQAAFVAHVTEGLKDPGSGETEWKRISEKLALAEGILTVKQNGRTLMSFVDVMQLNNVRRMLEDLENKMALGNAVSLIGTVQFTDSVAKFESMPIACSSKSEFAMKMDAVWDVLDT